MELFPEPPDVPAEQRATAAVHLRYEDVAQDGRVMLAALPQGVGEAVWRKLLVHHPMTPASRQLGIVPLLTRMVIQGGEGRVSVRHPLEAHGVYRIGHTVDAAGSVERMLLDMWVTLRGVAGRTHGPPPADVGAIVDVGRVFAEHVFTRPFGPPERRRVRDVDLPGLADRGCARGWRAPSDVAALLAGDQPLEPVASAEAQPVVFSLDHSDSNLHVNSLVYPRLLQEAALRRLSALGVSTASLLLRFVEIAYRKPCFAGERARIVLQAMRTNEGPGAVARLVSDREGASLDTGRPRCYARLVFAA